ncbi:hypothetical protein [Bradyrhizobium sp. USDA 4350]
MLAIALGVDGVAVQAAGVDCGALVADRFDLIALDARPRLPFAKDQEAAGGVALDRPTEAHGRRSSGLNAAVTDDGAEIEQAGRSMRFHVSVDGEQFPRTLHDDKIGESQLLRSGRNGKGQFLHSETLRIALFTGAD